MKTLQVMCPKLPGLIKIGEYYPGQTYEVSEEIAERLISVKGFIRVSEEEVRSVPQQTVAVEK